MNLRQALTQPLSSYIPLTELPRSNDRPIVPGGIATTPTRPSFVSMYIPPAFSGLQSIINGSRAQASAGQTAAR